MITQKIAVTVPKPLLVMIDDLIKQRGISRSSFISEAVREKILKEKERSIKETYDTIFSDESVRREQFVTAEWFDTCGNEEGQEW